MMKLAERVAALEANVQHTRNDVSEIKADVKLLLESKWKRDGKVAGVAAVISAIVAGIAALLK